MRGVRLVSEPSCLLGDEEVEDEPQLGLFSDVDHTRFGDAVDRVLLDDPALCVFRNTIGIVEINGEETTMALVELDGFEKWKLRRKGGGDLRTVGTYRDAVGKISSSFRDSVQALIETKFDDFPLPGPRALPEFLHVQSEGGGTASLGAWEPHFSSPPSPSS